MPADTILCDVSPGETRLALIEAARPVEFVVARPGQALGGIWLGRVVGRDRRLDAAFVDIGLDRPGLLPGEAAEGDAVMVRALTDPHHDKGVRLTREVSLQGRWAALTPLRPGTAVSRKIAEPGTRTRLAALARRLAQEGEGLVLRTAAADAADEAIAAEVDALRRRWRSVTAAAAAAKPPAPLLPPDPVARLLADNPGVRRLLVDDAAAFAALRRDWPDLAERHRDGPMFDLFGAAEELEAALDPTVPLPGGGSLVIEETAAACLVDVNSGNSAAGDANAAAVAALARQMRLRNLSGRILFDAIPQRRGRPQRLIEALRAAVAADPVPTHIVGATPLGLIEITRERRRASLSEVMLRRGLEPNAETLALAALRAALREAARPGGPSLRATPAVAAALARLPGPIAETERRLGRPLAIATDPAAGAAGYVLSWT